MRCKHCNERVKDTDFWCDYCGHPTGLVKNEFAANHMLGLSWKKFSPLAGKNYAFGIVSALLFLILVGGAYWFSINDSLLPVSPFIKYVLDNLVYLLVLPIFLSPFMLVVQHPDRGWSISDFFRSQKMYPRFFVFVLLNILYFFALKYICKGDPILNLVRFVMVQYWISIVLPAPLLMLDLHINPWRAIVASYHTGKEVRWNLYFLWLLLAILNMITILPFGLGLLITLPFTYHAIYDYYRKLVIYNQVNVNVVPDLVVKMEQK
jgi:hypothetical protein